MGLVHSKAKPEKPRSAEDTAFQLSFYSHPYDPNKNSTQSLASPSPCYDTEKSRLPRSASPSPNPWTDIERQQPTPKPTKKRQRPPICLACKHSLPEPQNEDEASVKTNTCGFLLTCMLIVVLTLVLTATIPPSRRQAFKQHTRGIENPSLQVVQVVNATNTQHATPTWQPVVQLTGKNGTKEWCEFSTAASLRTFPLEKDGKLARGIGVFAKHVVWHCNGTVVNEAWDAAEKKP